MKIPVLSSSLKDGYRVLFRVLGNDEDFQRQIWFVRGLLGIDKNQIKDVKLTPNNLLAIHQNASQYDRDFPTYEEVKNDFEILDDDLFEGELEMNSQKKNEIIVRRQKAQAFEKELNYYLNLLLNNYKLPLNWRQALEEYLLYGHTFIEKDEPVELTLSNTILKNPNNNYLWENPDFIHKYGKQREGIQITINRKISKDAFRKWFKEHWGEIEELFEKLHFAEGKEPRVKSIDKYEKVYLTRNKLKSQGKDNYDEVANILVEQRVKEIMEANPGIVSNDANIQAENELDTEKLREYYKRYKQILDRIKA